jgi:hypothetical protein
VQACFLEADMGTLTRERFRRKVRAFQLYESSGLFEEHWGHGSITVLVIVPSKARRDELVAVAQEVNVPRGGGNLAGQGGSSRPQEAGRPAG